MPIVDTWVLVNNSETPRNIIASGGKDLTPTIINNELFKNIEKYVKC